MFGKAYGAIGPSGCRLSRSWAPITRVISDKKGDMSKRKDTRFWMKRVISVKENGKVECGVLSGGRSVHLVTSTLRAVSFIKAVDGKLRFFWLYIFD